MTRSLTLPTRLPAMTPAAIDKVRALQVTEAARPQVPLETRHVLHGGMYARTILLPNGVELVAALIKIPTLVIVEGSVMVWLGSMSRWLTGQTGPTVWPAPGKLLAQRGPTRPSSPRRPSWLGLLT